jgi:hypothetical protein
MRYAHNEETRRKLDIANAAKSMHENTPLLEETLALRHGALDGALCVRVGQWDVSHSGR